MGGKAKAACQELASSACAGLDEEGMESEGSRRREEKKEGERREAKVVGGWRKGAEFSSFAMDPRGRAPAKEATGRGARTGFGEGEKGEAWAGRRARDGEEGEKKRKKCCRGG